MDLFSGTPGTCLRRERGVGVFSRWSVQPNGESVHWHWSILISCHACACMDRHARTTFSPHHHHHHTTTTTTNHHHHHQPPPPHTHHPPPAPTPPETRAADRAHGPCRDLPPLLSTVSAEVQGGVGWKARVHAALRGPKTARTTEATHFKSSTKVAREPELFSLEEPGGGPGSTSA